MQVVASGGGEGGGGERGGGGGALARSLERAAELAFRQFHVALDAHLADNLQASARVPPQLEPPRQVMSSK